MKGYSAFFGWRVAWAAFVVAIFGWGVGFYGPPVFLHAVVERTGWSISLVSGAVTVHFLCGAILVANSNAVYRRFGVAKVTFAGALLLALGILGWSAAVSPWQLFAAALFSGCSWVLLGAIAMNRIVSPWFEKKRPAALSLAYNGSSLGGVVFSPLWVALIAGLGFALGAGLVGIVMIVCVGIICRRYLVLQPADLGLRLDGEVSDESTAERTDSARPSFPGWRLYRDRSFLTLAAAMALGLFAQIGLIAHLFSILVGPLGAQGAGVAMGGATLSAIIGRTLTGFLLKPGLDRRYFASLSYGIQIAGSIIFIVSGGESIPFLVIGVALFGWGIGNATSLPPLIGQQDFGAADQQRVVALIVAFAQTAFALAPAVFGLIRSSAAAPEAFPALVFVLAMVCQVLAIFSLLAGRRRAFLPQADAAL